MLLQDKPIPPAYFDITTQSLRVMDGVIETIGLDSVHRKSNMADQIKDFLYKVPISAADMKMKKRRWSNGDNSIPHLPVLVA
mmetsp:Transcript_26494/g.26885  ORF Transcript_26494/g.26885 Transcript_26494/m.26885 type:complete len:82 (-) Transcript_26494:267-512(-)